MKMNPLSLSNQRINSLQRGGQFLWQFPVFIANRLQVAAAAIDIPELQEKQVQNERQWLKHQVE
jgi:hypothetical protein